MRGAAPSENGIYRAYVSILSLKTTHLAIRMTTHRLAAPAIPRLFLATSSMHSLNPVRGGANCGGGNQSHEPSMGEQVSTRWNSGRHAGGRAIIRRTTRTHGHSARVHAGGRQSLCGRLAANESQGSLRAPVQLRPGGFCFGSAAIGAPWAKGTEIALRLALRLHSRALYRSTLGPVSL